MWDQVDILLTANPSLLLEKPNDKFVVKYNTDYNKHIDSKFEISSFSEFDNIIKKIEKMYNNVLDLGELVKRAIKYLVEGIMVAIVAFSIPKQRLRLEEVGLIALSAAATFAILDVYVPSLAVSARSGAGFGIGANLVGFPR